MCWARLTKLMANVKNFLFNSDYEQDKIIYFKQLNNVPTSNGSSPSSTIAHGLPFMPLVFGVWSTSEDFSDTRTFGFVPESTLPYCTIQADATNITIYNYYTSPVYVRIYAFEPSTSTADIGRTSQNASTFVFNTDYNYSKLFAKGTLTAGRSVNHNLGYLPQVMAWEEYNNTGGHYIQPYSYSNALLGSLSGTNYGTGLTLTNSNLNYIGSGSYLPVIHYRIYYDEA